MEIALVAIVVLFRYHVCVCVTVEKYLHVVSIDTERDWHACHLPDIVHDCGMRKTF